MVNIKVNTPYRLLNLKAGTYLTLSDKDNVSLVGSQYADGTGQTWLFESAGTGLYFVKSTSVSQYIAVPTGSVVQGQQLEANTSPFVWTASNVDDIEPGARFTALANPNLYIDLYEGETADYTKVQLWPLTGNNQIWILEEIRN